LFLLTFFAAAPLFGQIVVHPKKADLPPEDEIWYGAATQINDSEWKYLKGAAKVRTSEMSISADEIDFNSDTAWAYARGHVHMEHYATGDILNADHAEYNIRTEEGKFYAISGTSPAKILTSPGVLTTTSPFYFQARWADRIKNRYVLHHGYITDCKMPKPWWKFESPKFDVVPGQHAIARHALLLVHHVPVLYLPYFYRPLGRNPRQSGFLTPNIGNSSLRGYMIGGGYYWAINRSYDVDYVLQYFTLRGPSHTLDFRGKPNGVTDFNFNYYAVQDKGVPNSGPPLIKEGGQEFNLTAKTQIWGFTAKLDLNYLSSFLFRVAFANSYNTALSSEVVSLGYLQRHFDDGIYSLNFVFSRNEKFEGITLQKQPNDEVTLQKLPSVEFFGRENQISDSIPLWFSFASTAGLFGRQESNYLATGTVFTFNTGLIMPRVDLEPRLSSSFKIAGISVNPSVTVGITDYGKTYGQNSTVYYTPLSCGGYPKCPPEALAYNISVQSANLLRKDADIVVGMNAPAIERIFTPPAWLHFGKKIKHVVELDATYEYVTGITDFQKIIRFDDTDIISDTNQLSFNLTNRLYKKDKAGKVTEVMTWRVSQARYFDSTFGDTIVAGQRNINLAVLEITPYTFLTGPRTYSPIESSLLVTPAAYFSFEYRTAYDPVQHRFIDHAFTSTFRKSKYSLSVSDTAITTIPLLVPQANQITFGVAYGTSTRRGWNLGGDITYDLLLHQQLFQIVQGTYNTDCCGWGFQIRRFNFGTNLGIRDESEYLFSFTLANLGTFGSMQKQDRIF
jgi:LPS-assembly protein